MELRRCAPPTCPFRPAKGDAERSERRGCPRPRRTRQTTTPPRYAQTHVGAGFKPAPTCSRHSDCRPPCHSERRPPCHSECNEESTVPFAKRKGTRSEANAGDARARGAPVKPPHHPATPKPTQAQVSNLPLRAHVIPANAGASADGTSIHTGRATAHPARNERWPSRSKRFAKTSWCETTGRSAKQMSAPFNSPHAYVAGCQKMHRNDNCTGTRYNNPMIRSFRHRGLRRLYQRDDPSRIPADQLNRITLALADLDAAGKPSDLDLPGYRLHPLRGDRRGSWSISITGNWRITFRFEAGDVHEVDLVDYH